MNKLLLTGLLALIWLKCFSTCIVIYIAKNGHIYVAADSRRTFVFNDNSNDVKFESVCKIHNVGARYFAIAGIDDSSLLETATRALQQNPNIDTAIKSFGTMMVTHYNALMADTKRYYPDKFKHFLKAGLADISFFGFFSGFPNIINVEFFCELDKNGKVVSKYRLHKVNNITIIGISQDITNSRPEELPSRETMEQNPELFVESLVKIEAKMQPFAVSEPIDILELKPNGPIWIRKNENAALY